MKVREPRGLLLDRRELKHITTLTADPRDLERRGRL
jgi:hypothetical protein